MDKSSTISENRFAIGILCLCAVTAACDYNDPGEPAMVHDSFGLDMVVAIALDSEDISAMRNSTYAKPKVRGKVWINDDGYFATISHCGATSVDDYKKNYELALDDAFEGRTIYRLSAMASDDSAMRALLAYRTFRKLGVDMPELVPAAVWVNEEYAGLFMWQEKIDEEYFEKRDIIPISLYQAENGAAEMFDTSNIDEQFSAKIGSKEKADLKHLIQTLTADPADDTRMPLEQILNVDNVLEYMAAVAYIDASDGIRNNFYFVRTRDEPRFEILPWDLDRTFYKNYPIDNGVIFERNHMMTRFFYDLPAYREKYDRYYREVAATVPAEDLATYTDELVALLREAFENDRYLSNKGKTLDEHAEALKAFFFSEKVTSIE